MKALARCRRSLVPLVLLGCSFVWVEPTAAAIDPDHAEAAPLIFDFRDADLRDVLRVMAEASGRSIIVGDDVDARVTLHFAARDWSEAIAVVVDASGLARHDEGGVLRVSTAETRIAVLEEARRIREAAEQSDPLEMRIFYVRNADAATLAEGISGAGGTRERSAGRGLLSDRGFLFVDGSSNALVVADVPERIERVAALVTELDHIPAQILIESEVVETSADTARTLGIQWGYRGAFGGRAEPHRSGPDLEGGGFGLGDGLGGVPWIASFPANIDPAAGSALGMVWGGVDGRPSAAVAVSALEREGRAKVISRPRVVTLNNTPATIKSLTVIRVKLPSTDTIVRTDGGAAAKPSVATEKIETGIVLVVTPRIVAGPRVVLDLFVKSSQADFSRQVDGIPTETSREATSRLVVEDGETVVLGGIYATVEDRRDSGVPFLRSIPIFGVLFRGRDTATRREDLLVFITPRILGNVRPAYDSEAEPG